MVVHTGWLFDLYPNPQVGISLWLLPDDDSQRLHAHMNFPVTFYAAGERSVLRRAWRFLSQKGCRLTRTTRHDLFFGERDLLAVSLPSPAAVAPLYQTLINIFPTLDYYDADIPLSLRFAARSGVHFLGHCRMELDGSQVTAIEPLDSPWDLHPHALPLRILELKPDCDPTRAKPQKLLVRFRRLSFTLDLHPRRAFLINLRAIVQRCDPDLILSEYGDTWLFPRLLDWCRHDHFDLNLNRDGNREVITRHADSYFAYGQVIYRGEQTHLLGRWHIDRKNALMFNEYGLEGVLEQARVTSLGVQEVARKSPGAGITALQMITALQDGILIPAQKQQAEGNKSLSELIRADKGGLIYQPLTGVHYDVAQIDFASMYPAIIVNYNISPETIAAFGRWTPAVRDMPPGLIPRALRPLLEKRLALKRESAQLDSHDCRVKTLQQRAAALKWLLVVCFGYLGYKNARFGKIESHESVTAISRELLLQAKETAEAAGFEVLHMYVDCLFVKKPGCREPQDFAPLLHQIEQKTGIPIALEGIFKWLVFAPSKADSRIPVPNRYFGAFHDGELKYRGIALRRHDTCRFVAETQLRILKTMAQSSNPLEKVPEARSIIQFQLQRLHQGRVPLEDLQISQKLSRVPEAYRQPSPAAQAALQFQAQGHIVRPGMRLQFWYAQPGVQIAPASTRQIYHYRYQRLIEKAAEEILSLFFTPPQLSLFAAPRQDTHW